MKEDTQISDIKKNPKIDIFLIQAKRSSSFSELAIDRIIATIESIFDLTKDMAALRAIFNERLIDLVEVFRKAYLELASRHPILKIKYIYASKGDISSIHPKVHTKAQILQDIILSKFSGVTAEVDFVGARELLEAARREKSYTLQVKFLENYISRKEDNYIILSTLKDYYEFITDESNNVRKYIFEANVRDYQGDVQVNSDIRKTLHSNDDFLDFWWLNNGITILASKASIVGKKINLDDVQIVNGLQTTIELYNYLKNKNLEELDDERAVLIRIIVVSEPEARDRIIKATNFQTSIPIASLRATDRVHRDIEDFFQHNGLYYDRRKNYYKNIGKPADKIIGIPYLAQAVMAIVLREPHNARSRPSSLIKQQNDYKRVFNNKIDLPVYLFCANAMKKIDKYIRSGKSQIAWQFLSNFRFHIAMLLTFKITGKAYYNLSDLRKVINQVIDDDMISILVDDLFDSLTEFLKSGGELPIDALAKSKDFYTFLIARAEGGSNGHIPQRG